MLFTETNLKGAFVIDIEKKEDERGFFARIFCQEEFKRQGINDQFVQNSISYNEKKGTLRGLHYQEIPYQESKLVSCIRGSAYDVIVDLRADSPTYCKWTSNILTAENYKTVYVPHGFAHGFQTLENNTVLFYQISTVYQSEYARGIRWNDPRFCIEWPSDTRVISQRDQQFPDLVT